MCRFLSGALLLAAFFLLATATAAELELLWSEPLQSSSLVAAASARTYVASGSSITAYGAETGERLWRASGGGPISRITADEHRAYTLTGSGLLRAFTGAGTILWQRNVPTGGLGLHLNAVSGGLLLAGSIWERLTAFTPVTGTELWRTENPMAGTQFSLVNSVLIAHGTQSGAITIPVTRALDAGSGAEMWVQQGWSPLKIGPERTVLWQLPDGGAAAAARLEIMTVDTVTGTELAGRTLETTASQASPSVWLGAGVLIAARNGTVPLSETPLSDLGPGAHCCFVRQFFTAPLMGDEPLTPVGNSLSGSTIPLHVSWPHIWLSRQWESPTPLLRLDLRSGELAQVAELPGTLHHWTATADALLLVTEEGGLGRLELTEPVVQFSQIPGQGPGSSAVELSALPGRVLVRYPERIFVYGLK